MIEGLEPMIGELRSGRSVALATVMETWGSAPVPAGGAMVVDGEQRFWGSVSGGCVEGDVIAIAGEVMATRNLAVRAFGVDDATAWRAGLPCGGNIRVLVEPFAGADDLALLTTVAEHAATRRPIAVLTDLATGAHALVEPSATTVGDDAIAQRLADGASGVVPLPTGGEAFLRVIRPAPRLLVVGGVHIAQQLARMAFGLGFEAIIVDPREAFAAPARFPGCRVVAEWPEAALPAIGLDLETAVVVLSHVADIDDEALAVALRAEPGYVGALGSRRSHAKRRERLAARGFGAAALDRIHAPIGLDIGAATPGEIALAILAQVVAQRRRAVAGARSCAAA